MYKFTLQLFCLLLISTYSFSQAVLKGTVTDGKTNEPLPYVNVFINNTTQGTVTDIHGKFDLDIPLGESDVIFSFVGYRAHKAKVSTPVAGTINFDVRLMPLKQELENVTVTSTKDKEWEKLMKQFESIFLGANITDGQCKILNRWCIDPKKTRVKGQRVLIATASQPIQIQNTFLGYTILYDLQNFTATSESYKFQGYAQFKALETTDSVQALRWARNRLNAYHGSSRNLLKAIIDDRVVQEGFSVFAYNPALPKNVRRSKIFTEDLGKTINRYQPPFRLDSTSGKYIIYMQPRMEVHYERATAAYKTYADITAPVAGLNFTKGKVEVDKNGVIFNPEVLTTTGYMSNARIAHQLPVDYAPEKAAEFVRHEKISLNEITAQLFKEKVYLHTDKSYYHPGDVLWLKGYLKYKGPEVIDTLSGGLFVELINARHEITDSKILFIDSGRVSGDFALPADLAPGNYYLRAYTNWMRNYPATDFFVKPIPVLAFDKNVLATNFSLPVATTNLEIGLSPSHKRYAPRELISISISLKDEFDNPISADLSVSVTDVASAVPLREEPNITRSWMTETAHVQNQNKEYPIERGITLHGQFKTDKDKPKKVRLTIVQGNMDDMTEVETDENGIFWVTGFHCFDSTEFAFRAVDAKRKKIPGKVKLFTRDVPPLPDTLPLLNVPLQKQAYDYRPVVSIEQPLQATMLEAVEVKSTKIENVSRKIPRIGTADFAIDKEYLSRTNSNDLIQSLQYKIPGLRLMYVDGDYYLVLGGVNSFGSVKSMEPLLVIDGVADYSDGNIRQKLQMIHPTVVERVEVYKNGSAAAYGSRGANGVIAIYTKVGESKEKTPVGYDREQFQLQQVKGYSAPNVFRAPSYKDKELTSDGDYRTTILWQPWLKTDAGTGEASFSFYAADAETTYRIVVEGVTSSGEPIHIEDLIQIRSERN